MAAALTSTSDPVSGRPGGASVWYAGSLLVVIATIYVLGAAPGIAWLLLVAAMCLLRTDSVAIRRGLAIAVVFSAAAVYSSRDTAGSFEDDLANVYYPMYMEMHGSGVMQNVPRPEDGFQISSVEVAMPALLLLVAVLPVKLSAAGLVFVLTFVGGLLYLWWLERYLLPELPDTHRLAGAALSLTLFSFGLCSQTARQLLGVPVLLAAIWERRPARAWVLAVASAAFHLTAVPVFAAWRLVVAWPRASLAGAAFVGGALLLRGPSLVEALLGVDVGAFDKLAFYAQALNEEVAGFDRAFLPVVAVLCGAAWIGRQYRDGAIFRLLLVFAALFVALLPLPLASFRLTLFALAGLLGPMLALAAAPRIGPRRFAAFAFAAGAVMLSRRLMPGDPASGMSLWHSFSIIEPIPFRYLSLWLS